jgi:hypothetical protein
MRSRGLADRLQAAAAGRCDRGTPTGQEALDEPFRAFPSWFMRITCDRCGKDRMLNEAHMKRSDVPIRDIIARMRHDGCGGRAGRVELLTGIEGAQQPAGAADLAWTQSDGCTRAASRRFVTL